MGNYFCERDEMYGSTKLTVAGVTNPQMNKVAAATAPTTVGELLESLYIVPGKLQIPQGTCRLGSSYMRISLGKPHTSKHISSHLSDKKLDSSPSNKKRSV